MANPPKTGKAPTPKLDVATTLDILRATVPRLEALTRDVPVAHLDAVTSYGWSVSEQLAHLRAVGEALGGNILRIVREDQPAWRAVSPRSGQERHFGVPWHEAFTALRDRRAELLDVLEDMSPGDWQRTAAVTAPPNTVYQYSALYYGDWLARHERSHLGHMARILRELGTPG